MVIFQIHAPAFGTSFPTGSVIEANGSHSLDLNWHVWTILRDIYGHYYLQNPPVTLHSQGTWNANNIHLGHDIVEIMFVKVTAKGNDDFSRKVKHQEWGAFDEFPAGTETLGTVNIRV
jgi:hypothetical protein